jgi:hypothetical protein
MHIIDLIITQSAALSSKRGVKNESCETGIFENMLCEGGFANTHIEIK